MKKGLIIAGSVVLILVVVVGLGLVRRNRLAQNTTNGTVIGQRNNNAQTSNSTNTNTSTNTTSGNGGSAGGTGLSVGDHKLSVDVNGTTRTYLIHVPTFYKPGTPAPLVIAYHGGGGDGGQSQENLSRMSMVADRGAFVLIYPDGINKQWSDGRAYTAEKTNNADDIAFTKKLIETTKGQLTIDAQRIYATGISNGGMMAYRLACEMSDTFAAVAPVSSALTSELQAKCNPSAKVAIMAIQGTADPLIPYSGGEIKNILGLSTERGTVLGTDDAIKFWVDKNKCATPPETINFTNTAPKDGTTTTRTTYTCEGGYDVSLVKVENGGHTWPGGVQYLPEASVGKTSRDFIASNVVWDFLKQKKR